MPDGEAPSGILESANQTKNWIVRYRFDLSLSSRFLSIPRLNGISEIPKDIGLSRRPTAREFESST